MVEALGRGGQARVAEAAGMSWNPLIGGAKESAGGAGPSDRVRRPGAGRKKAVDLENPKNCGPTTTTSDVTVTFANFGAPQSVTVPQGAVDYAGKG